MTIISAEDIETINQARTVLEEVQNRAFHARSREASFIYAKADTAGDALFDLLNWFDSYCGAGLTPAQLHNPRRREAEVSA